MWTGKLLFFQISAGDTALFLNGIKFEVDDLDIFQLVDTLRQEEKLSTGFFNMGFRVGGLLVFTLYRYKTGSVCINNSPIISA